MSYTKHLLDQARLNGAPQMDAQAFEKILKIIYLEGRCDSLKGAMKSMQRTEMPHFFDVAYLNMGKQLTQLTGNRDPKSVFEEILRNPH